MSSSRLGGGGTSAGGVFTVRGKLSEPSPAGATLSGGSFSVTGGLVSTIAIVFTPDAPKLALKRTVNGFEISWPLPAEGFVLQETTVLANPDTTVWLDSTVPFTDEGGRRIVNLPSNGPRRFFRLSKPVP